MMLLLIENMSEILLGTVLTLTAFLLYSYGRDTINHWNWGA